MPNTTELRAQLEMHAEAGKAMLWQGEVVGRVGRSRGRGDQTEVLERVGITTRRSELVKILASWLFGLEMKSPQAYVEEFGPRTMRPA